MVDGLDTHNTPFTPTTDFAHQVDLYVSRDLDSRFSDREKAAVQEWLESKADFHFMRDHPHHGTKILGSGWGSKLTRPGTRLNWRTAWNSGFTDKELWAKRNSYGPDQTFLSRYYYLTKLAIILLLSLLCSEKLVKIINCLSFTI